MTSKSAAPERGRLRAAWTLVLLTVSCAELSFTAIAVPQTWYLLPLLLIMYGAGVLLIREAVVRFGVGWPSLVLLGVAYELAEDGIGLQALTSPDMYGAADWGWRAGGANVTYWASQLGVHVVFSVLIPVMLVGVVYPAHRGRPFLRRGGLVVVGVLTVVGVAGLRFVIAATEDADYRTPLPWIVAFLVAIAVLVWLALRVVPPLASPRRLSEESVPKPAVVGAATGVATLLFLLLLLPLGLGSGTVLGDGVPGLVPVIVAALIAVGIGAAVLRWSESSDWSDLHRVGMAGGILIAHTAFMMPGSWSAVITGTITVLLEVTLLTILARRVRSRLHQTQS